MMTSPQIMKTCQKDVLTETDEKCNLKISEEKKRGNDV